MLLAISSFGLRNIHLFYTIHKHANIHLDLSSTEIIIQAANTQEKLAVLSFLRGAWLPNSDPGDYKWRRIRKELVIQQY